MAAGALPKYDAWLDFFFGRIGRESDDPWELNWHFEASPSETADLFISTLTNCGRDLVPYTDSQVAAGLNGLLFSNYGSVPHVLIGAGLSEAQRIAILASFMNLYRDCLAVRSPPLLGHRSETQGNPLEFVTYMLWDVSPIDVMAKRSDARLATLLDVFRRSLRLPNEACAESVLHGLGHMGGKARKHAASMIEEWLDERPKVRPELIAYAKAAHTGCIL